MFDAHHEILSTRTTSWPAVSEARGANGRIGMKDAETRIVVRDFARSRREALAVYCLRLVLSAQEDADMSHLARAYELAERQFERLMTVDYVRTLVSIARALRREREFGFHFLRDAQDVLTSCEGEFLLGLQAAIDGNSIGVDAAALVLTQAPCGRAIAEDLWRLGAFALTTDRIRRVEI